MTGGGMPGLEGLSADERGRLERFAGIFDRLDASRYATFSDTVEADGVQEAQAAAVELIGVKGPRRDAVRTAIRAFTDAATEAYARRMSLPDTILLFQSLPDRADDRLHFLQSVERAVVGLVLWTELDEGHRAALIGPWAVIAADVLDLPG